MRAVARNTSMTIIMLSALATFDFNAPTRIFIGACAAVTAAAAILSVYATWHERQAAK